MSRRFCIFVVALVAALLVVPAAFALRGPVSGHSRTLLRLSERSSIFANAGLVLILATGIWMAFRIRCDGSQVRLHSYEERIPVWCL